MADSQQVYPSFASVPFPPTAGHQQSRQDEPELTPDGQHYFPSFSSIFSNHPLGHSRPPVFDDPPPSSHRPRHIPYALQQANSFDAFASSKGSKSFPSTSSTTATTSSSAPAKEASASDQQAILGSGNFGVIRGGTFYEDDYDSGSSNDDFFYYGGGRPSYSYNFRPSHSASASTGDDFFANFRDFADITAPKQGAYSQLHVVYANRNGTLAEQPPASAPRNIFEQLEQLERKPAKQKLSKSKAKLAKHQQKEASKLEWKKLSLHQAPKDLYNEPLLALS